MQQQSLTDALDRPMNFIERCSSQGRGWTGVEARVVGTTGGVAVMKPSTHHSISMHLSTPVRANCRFEGRSMPRLQVAGDIDLLPAGSSAAWRDEGPTEMLVMHVNASLLYSAADSIGVNLDRVVIPPKIQLRDAHIEHIGLALKAELESEQLFGRVYAESLGVALAVHLLRTYGAPPSQPLEKLSKRRLRRVIEYIRDNMTQDLSLMELAGVAGVSSSHLKSQFRQLTGLPVHQYIIRQRVDCAVELILGSRLPLSEIAVLAGFANQSHMARHTRRLTGATPNAIRQQQHL